MGVIFADIESPYAGKSEEELRRNLLYARACVRDSLFRGEIPFASHLFYTQPGILDDNLQLERARGIHAGKTLIGALPGIITAVYRDLGISKGMEFGIACALEAGRRVDYRMLGAGWEEREKIIAQRHSHAGIWGCNEK